jgi:hypothetical protein
LSDAATLQFNWASCDVGAVLASVACAVVNSWEGGGNRIHILVLSFCFKDTTIFDKVNKNFYINENIFYQIFAPPTTAVHSAFFGPS